MRHEQAKKLLAHWRTLARPDGAPDRNDIDPAQIASALQDVFILGRGPDMLWRYRVAGTRLAALADRELRGELFTGWWRPHDQLDVSRLLASVAQGRGPAVGGVSALAGAGGRSTLELLLLPLRHGGAHGRRMIGGLFPGADLLRRADMRLAELALVSMRFVAEGPDGGDVFGQAHPDIDRRIERRHGLRLIEGGLA